MNRPNEENDYSYPQVARFDNGYYTDEDIKVNYNKPIGRCPNCADIIYEGEATLSSTVHDRCYEDFRQYLMSEQRNIFSDDS